MSETSNEWVLPERDPDVWRRFESHSAYLDRLSQRLGPALVVDVPGPLHEARPCGECGGPLREHERVMCWECVREAYEGGGEA